MSSEPRMDEGPLRNSAERLRLELDKWLDAAWTQGERAFDAMGLRGGRLGGPAVDIVERPESFVVFADVPGLNPEQIQLTLAGNMLTIQGEHPPLTEPPEAIQRQERAWGPFKRAIPLPAPVEAESISAECRLGVLRITIAKTESEKARRIPVRSGEATSGSTPLM